jgi:hypothetical protein
MRIDWMRLINVNKTIMFEIKKEGRFTRYYISGTSNYISLKMFVRLVKQYNQPAMVKMVFA